ncbi:hypothetical protein E1B28_013041 [Marasmius oreades]|uniref:Uncharacterized protein n=1 Tax=Marasmius oreades TaxID=181124 RepID=A0A9P7RP41_9AGAR|nr:uncharacterized protein E1B28_013041 [Marasmius oreades]KAG7087060.1 hypothetical protein E1B28_013041 [Marasmius oreades]
MYLVDSFLHTRTAAARRTFIPADIEEDNETFYFPNPRLCTMRRYGIIYTLVSSCLTCTAFRIDPPLPLTVIEGSAVPFTWIRDSTDPAEFSFLEIPLDPSPLVPVLFQVNMDQSQQESGSITLTFFQPSPYMVAAVDHDKNTFFTAPGAILVNLSGSRLETPAPSTDVNSDTGIRNPTPAYTSIIPPTNSPTATVTVLTQSDESRPHKSNTGAIAGGVVGGVLVLLLTITFAFCVLKRRRKKLKDDFEAYEQSAQESNSRSGAIPDGVDKSTQEDVVQVLLRRQMEVLTKIMATLEAGPPDYSSRAS